MTVGSISLEASPQQAHDDGAHPAAGEAGRVAVEPSPASAKGRNRVRKQGLTALTNSLAEDRDDEPREQQQQPRLPRTPPPSPDRGDDLTRASYMVRRFLVIKCDEESAAARDSGDTSPPSFTPGGEASPAPAQDLAVGQGTQASQGLCLVLGDGKERPVDADDDHPKAPPRKGSLYPSATSRPPFREDESQCCFAILHRKCVRWARRACSRDSFLGHSLSEMQALPIWPNATWLTRFLAMVMIGALFLSTAIIVIGGDGWFEIITAIVLAQMVGHLVHMTTSLPPLLGMLVVGVCMRELGYVQSFSTEHASLLYVVRSWALVVFMVRTGFRLDAAGVHRLPPLMVGLAIVPGLVEAASVAILAKFVLGMPGPFAVLTGVVLAAACPSILRPCFSMMGAGRAVHSALLAVACLNDMIVIVLFGVLMAVIFSVSGDTLPYMFLHRMMGVACGICIGVVFGFLVRFVPDRYDPQVVSIRSVLLGSVGLFAILGFARIGFFSGGPVACIVAAWVCSWGWRKQGWSSDFNPVATVFNVLWNIMQPIMFCLMGADLELPDDAKSKLLMGIGVLLFAWLVRMIVSLAITAYGDLSVKERIYVALSWLPKADVQAVLCPLALDQARYRGDADALLVHARYVMLLVLLAVIVTAPLSAALTSPRGLVNVLLKEVASQRTSKPEAAAVQANLDAGDGQPAAGAEKRPAIQRAVSAPAHVHGA